MPRRRRTRAESALPLRLAAFLGAAAFTTVLGGCAAPPGPAVSPLGVRVTAADLEVAVVQYRSDRPGRLLGVEIHNLSPEPLEISGVSLAADVFASELAYAGHVVTIPAGATRAMRLDLPHPACPSPPRTDGAGDPGAQVTIELEDSGAPVVVAAGDPYGSLLRIAVEDCAIEAVGAVVELTGTSVSVDGAGSASTAHLTVDVEPSGTPGVVQLLSVEPTVLLSPQAGADWPLGLAVDGSTVRQSVILAVVPTRCDPHVIAEDKVGTSLSVVAVTPDGTEQRVPLPLRDGVKEQLLAFVAEHCGL